MRVLLCYPLPRSNGGTAAIPKLGLAYLAAALRRAGHHVEVLDQEQRGVRRKRRAILHRDWDLVGFQVFSGALPSLSEVVGRLRARRPETIVVAGGPLASGMPETLLRICPEIDYVLRGEAEESFCTLIDVLEREGDLGDLPGVAYRCGDEIHSGPAPVSPDIDRLAPPALDLMPPAAYPNAPVGGIAAGFPVGPVISTRGCPYPCPYCAARAVHGRGIRTIRPSTVVAEMRRLVDEFGVREIQFLDDCFGYDRDHAHALLDEYASAPWRVPVSFPNGMRLDQLDEPLVAAMRRAGVHAVTFGVDFGSDRMLARTGRGMDVAAIRSRLELMTRTSGIRLTGNFILGHFDDTREGMEQTVRLAGELPLDRAHFSAYIPIPGTPDWRRLERGGLLDGIDLGTSDFSTFQLPHPQMTRTELARLKRRAYVEFYARPSRLLRLIADVRSPGNLAHLVRKAVYHR